MADSIRAVLKATPAAGLAVLILVLLLLRPLVDLAVESRIGPVSLGQLWGGVLIALAFTYVVLRRQAGEVVRRLWPAAALALAFAALTLWRPDAATAVTESLKLVQFVLIAAFAFLLSIPGVPRGRAGDEHSARHNPQRLFMWLAVTLSVLVIASVGYRVCIGQFGNAYYTGGYDTTAQGPHGTALFAVMLLPLLLGVRGRRSHQLVAHVLSIALVGIVVLSYVRSALLALLSLLAWWVFARDTGNPLLTRRVKIIASAVLTVAVAVLAGPEIVKRFSDLRFLFTGGAMLQFAGGSRVGIWGAVISEILARPMTLLYGQGAGASVLAVKKYFGLSIWAHNDFLELLITGGLPLLGAYAAVIAASFNVLGRARRWGIAHPESPLSGAYLYGPGVLLGFLLMSFLNAALFFPATLLLAILIGCAAGDISSEERTGPTG